MTNKTPIGCTEDSSRSAAAENTRPRRRRQQHTSDLLRRHRLSLGGNSTNQKTLTQIDFVQRTPRPEELLNEADFQEIQNLERTDDALERIPTPSMAKPKSKKRKSGHSAGRRTSGRREEYNDRTLTQMVNVDMSHGTEDNNLDDADQRPSGASRERSARKRSARDMDLVDVKPENHSEGEGEGEGGGADDNSFTPAKKARRDDGIKTEERDEIHTDSIWSRPRDHATVRGPRDGSSQVFLKPQTPQKQRRYVVPSSQSPESPEITFCTPQKVKDAPIPFPQLRSPSKARAKNESPLKQSTGENDAVGSSLKIAETPPLLADTDGSQLVHNSFSADIEVTEGESTPLSPLSQIRPVGELSESFKNDIRVTPSPDTPETQRRKPIEEKPKVIYETDGDESGTESFHDAVSQPQNTNDDNDRTLVPPSQPGNSNSPRHLDSYHDLESTYSNMDATMRSDASLLYARRPLSYAYEKLHDTQDLGVDFNKLPRSPRATSEAPGLPELAQPSPITQPEIPTELAKAKLEDTKQEEIQQVQERSRPPSPILQIESSQRSEIEICASDTSESPRESRGVLTASQLLTDSLLESIPGPPAWLFKENHTQEELENR